MDQGFRAHQFIVSVTYALESVCANVTTGWDVVHRELACQYGKSSLRILGAAFGETDVTYSPHMEWSGVLLAAGFQEPLYWAIVEPARVDDMLETLSGVLRKTIAADEFYTRHPPSDPAFFADPFDICLDLHAGFFCPVRHESCASVGIVIPQARL
jgi:hypothetical protein